MFNFEREIGIEEEDKITLHPRTRQSKLPFRGRWIVVNWQDGMKCSATLPFFLLALLSFLIVVESQFAFFLPTVIIIGALALVVAVLFR